MAKSPRTARPQVRPFLFDGLPESLADLLTLGWEIHSYAHHSGRHGPGERLARVMTCQSVLEGFLSRLAIAVHGAVGIVTIDSPAFAEWERRVVAVEDTCIAAIRGYRPDSINAGLTNAVGAAVQALERAGSGFRANHKDTSPDTPKNFPTVAKRGPRNAGELLRFQTALEKGLKKGEAKIEIALEFTNGNEHKAQALLKQAYRYSKP